MQRWALAGAVLMMVGALAYGASTAFGPGYSYADELARVVACADDAEPARCMTPGIGRLLDGKSARDALSDLDAALETVQCHYAGHILGAEVYRRADGIEQAMAQCSGQCNASCTHGVVSEMFATEVGFDADMDVAHLDDEDLKTLARRLCVSGQACHGVGHVVYAMYPDLTRSMDVCDAIAPARYKEFCYNGAAMELADVLSGRSLRPGDAEPVLPELSDLCRLEDESHARNCFVYLPRIVRETHEREGAEGSWRERIASICEAVTDPVERFSCFAGIGSDRSAAVIDSPDSALRICSPFSGRDLEACVVGIASKGAEDRQDHLRSYCALHEDESIRSICYQAIFFAITRAGGTLGPVDALCSDDAACRRGHARSGISVWASSISR